MGTKPTGPPDPTGNPFPPKNPPPQPAAAPTGSGLLQEPSKSEGVSQDEVEIDQTLEDYLKQQGK